MSASPSLNVDARDLRLRGNSPMSKRGQSPTAVPEVSTGCGSEKVARGIATGSRRLTKIAGLTLFGFIFLLAFLGWPGALIEDDATHRKILASLFLTGITLVALEDELSKGLTDVGSVILFLLPAMGIVESIDHMDGFAAVTSFIVRYTQDHPDRLMPMICTLAFFLSSVIDNLTATIVCIKILKRVVPHNQDWRHSCGGVVVVAANAGGAWSPIGDVTTTMLWIQHKISTFGTVVWLFFPSLVAGFAPLFGIWWQAKKCQKGSLRDDAKRDVCTASSTNGTATLIVGMLCILMVPVVKMVTGLPPYLGMMMALGVFWLVAEICELGAVTDCDEEAGTAHSLRGVPAALHKVDLSSLLFFTGVLLGVAALESAEVLERYAKFMEEVTHGSSLLLCSLLGVSSAVVDNVPLVQASIEMFKEPMDSPLWQLTALAAGTGGSMLAVGSVAGFPTGHHLLSEPHRRAFPRVGLAMSFGSSSPAVLEDRLQSVGVSENKAKSQLGPKSRYVGSSVVLLGLVFVVSKRVPLFATEGTNHRRLSEATSPQLASSGCCRFAKEFEGVDWHDAKTRADYMANVMYMERGFLGGAAKLSFDPDTGMTYDGVGLDDSTGEVQHGTLRTFSAPSKEALHLSLLALALQPVEDVPAELATVFPLLYSADEALDILDKKAKTMEDFDSNYPGFGGFLPWFCSRGINQAGHCKTLADPGTKMTPVSGWERTLPGLDNGQLAFGAAAVVHVLERRAKQEGTSSRFARTARRWNARLERMKESVVNLFYNGAGLVRMVSELDNVTVDIAKNASNAHNENGLFLWDAFEGEMIVLFLDIFGNWTKYPNNGEEEKKLMWKIKAEHVEPVVYTAADDTKMVLQKGYWFSAHEQWKTLQLPYMDIPLVKHLFANGEFARLETSVQEQLPGLMASVNAPNGVQCDAHPYCSAVGIQSLAEEPVFSFKESETVLTPYAAFPSILVDPAAGLAWYNHMLAMPRVQTPVGSIESFTVTGKAVAPMATWDAKVTTVLAMLGGTGPLLRNYMEERGVYGIFEDRVKSMYEPVFKPVITSVMPGKASVDLHIAQLPQLPWPAPHPASRESVPEDFPSWRRLSLVCASHKSLGCAGVRPGPGNLHGPAGLDTTVGDRLWLVRHGILIWLSLAYGSLAQGLGLAARSYTWLSADRADFCRDVRSAPAVLDETSAYPQTPFDQQEGADARGILQGYRDDDYLLNLFRSCPLVAISEPIVAKLESGLFPRSVLVQLGFQPNAGLRIFYRRTFLEESQHVLLAKGETLFVFPPGGARPPLRLLPDMLRRVNGWQVPLTAPRGLLQSAFKNSSPYRCLRWHCSHTARVNVPAQLLDGGEDLRCFLAGVLRGDALEKFCVSFGPASPRILRHGPALPRRPYRYTEVLPRIPCPPALLAPPCTGPIRTGPTCQRPLGTTLKLVVAPPSVLVTVLTCVSTSWATLRRLTRLLLRMVALTMGPVTLTDLPMSLIRPGLPRLRQEYLFSLLLFGSPIMAGLFFMLLWQVCCCTAMCRCCRRCCLCAERKAPYSVRLWQKMRVQIEWRGKRVPIGVIAGLAAVFVVYTRSETFTVAVQEVLCHSLTMADEALNGSPSGPLFLGIDAGIQRVALLQQLLDVDSKAMTDIRAILDETAPFGDAVDDLLAKVDHMQRVLTLVGQQKLKALCSVRVVEATAACKCGCCNDDDGEDDDDDDDDGGDEGRDEDDGGQ
eukprot:s363_g5.t1